MNEPTAGEKVGKWESETRRIYRRLTENGARKTDRIYGHLTKLVLTRSGPFTPPELTHNGHTARQINLRCRQLFNAGKLDLIRPAKRGPNQPPPIYCVKT